MSFLTRPNKYYLTALAVAGLAVFTAAPVWAVEKQLAPPTMEIYTDQALPEQPLPQYAQPNKPVKPGELTLEDVIGSRLKKKQAAAKTPAKETTAPSLAKKPSAASSANVMLMHGMRAALKQAGEEVTPLRPPQIPGAQLINPELEPASVPTTNVLPPPPVAPMSAPGFTYEPGREPKSLGISGVESSVPAPAAPQASRQPVPEPYIPSASGEDYVPLPAKPAYAPSPSVASRAPAAPTKRIYKTQGGIVTSAGCSPYTETWSKSCAEVGYPENFTGDIRGETRTVCPEGTLQDVWISNTCAAPGDTNEWSPTSSNPAPSIASSAPAPSAYAEASREALAESQPVASALPLSQPQTRGDASCGAANGLAASARPAGDLCAAGDVSEVSGDGPWRWSCNGYNGGMSVSCMAPVALATVSPPQPKIDRGGYTTPSAVKVIEDGICGAADGAGTDRAPAGNLCAKGTASRVSGEGPWTWACSGLNGGTAAACEAPRRADGICGSANGVGTEIMPIEGLCASGLASAVTGDGPWNWTCSGVYGGAPVVCSAAPKRDAVCGSASITGHRQTPRDNLCSVGQSSAVSGSGPWTWACGGANGGSTVACTAPVSENGACGAANGVGVTTAPSDGLCSRGTPTRVSGSGPWSWNCSGVDGGDTQSCTAPVAFVPPSLPTVGEAPAPKAAPTPVVQPETVAAPTPPPVPAPAPTASASSAGGPTMCGQASELAALQAPDRELCNSGSPSSVSGNGPWNWTCTQGGRIESCSTLSPDGFASAPSPAVGFSEAMGIAPPPSAAPAPAVEEAPKVAAAPAAVAAPEPVPALAPAPAAAPAKRKPIYEEEPTCGASAGQGLLQAPNDNLCAVGKATRVTGAGPWHWTCLKGKFKTQCEAPRLIDAECGTANGSIQKYAPTSNLCTRGTPTEIQGAGPWLWTCVGSGGGASISCSAASQAQQRVDGGCGIATNTATNSAPLNNLCDSGVPSNVYGEGPWTWTCSGLNGGVAVSCATQKNVPPAPLPPGPSVNGLCGAMNGVALNASPIDDLCSAGTATGVSGNGPWNWNCIGENGGMTVSCTAPMQPPAPITGACGAASGVPTITIPKSALCSAGISSAVSGRGPWTWSCSGTNGGGAVACVAPYAGSGGGNGGLPSLVTPSLEEGSAPQAAPTRSVTSSSRLTTPRLSGPPLAPIAPDVTPNLTPSKGFSRPPEPSSLPPVPVPNEGQVSSWPEPDLPEGTKPLQPPPIRDTLKPSPALRPPAINADGETIPGNRFTLPEAASLISFEEGQENLNEQAAGVLSRLADLLETNSNVRVTLVAYASNKSNVSPREARRLSLSRALAARDFLTTRGISSGRIDVKAMGANVPSGEMDRIDVKVN